MNRLFIVAPAYNEQTNIENFIGQWYPIVQKYGDDSRMVVIDDGSRDDTYRMLCDMASERPALVALTKPNGGHGPAVLFGYHYALDNGADYVFQTDSDGQTDPADFPGFWDLRDSFDMVIGERTQREDGASRRVVTKVLKSVVKSRFHVDLPDANTPYRLMGADMLRQNIAPIPDDFYLANVALCAAYAKFDCSMKSIPISFKQRRSGENSINIPSIVGIGRRALGDFSSLNGVLDAEAARRSAACAQDDSHPVS